MPGPFVQDPTPAWLKPQNASVTDSTLTRVARANGGQLQRADVEGAM
jgi:hypothetical protein